MNSGRLREYVRPAVTLLVGVGVITLGVLLLADWQFPGLINQLNLSAAGIGDALAGQAAAAQALTGLSPFADLLLFMASYALVCIFLWLQSEVRAYLANRNHFE